jgi:hypothetical protein
MNIHRIRTSVSALLASGTFFLFAPLALAQSTAATGGKLGTFIDSLISIIDNILVPFVFALAFIVFIYGIYQYFILGGANEEKRDAGKQLMVWGFIGFFIMVSVWGIVNVLVGTFGLGSDSRPALPTFNSSGGSTSGSQVAPGLPTAPNVVSSPAGNAKPDCRNGSLVCSATETCQPSGNCLPDPNKFPK